MMMAKNIVKKRRVLSLFMSLVMVIMVCCSNFGGVFSIEAKAETVSDNNVTSFAGQNTQITSTDNWIAVTDQQAHKILVMDPEVQDWNSSEAVKWSWYPNAANGFADVTPGWRLPSDVKLRTSAFYGGQMMTVTDTDGFCAIIPYPAGNTKKWSIDLTTAANPVSAELLPDGNIAIAAAKIGKIRIYNASQGETSTTYCEADMLYVNGVLWDPSNQILWAAGNDYLTGYKVGGTSAAPTLTEDTDMRINLPTKGAKDLQPVNGDADRLWVVTGTEVYQYIKSTKSWDSNYAGSSSVNVKGTRSIGNQPDGKTLIETVQGGGVNSVTTKTIRIYRPEGNPSSETRVRDNMSAYRARVWNPDYCGSKMADNKGSLIAATDQSNVQIVVFDPIQTEWNKSSSVVWSWSPDETNGFQDTTGWYYPSDVKLRNSTFHGGQVMLTCASGGFSAIASYPAGNRLWSADVGGLKANPHAVELLPNGNIAIAASLGGWVRIYTASQGADSKNYVEYNLKGAHGTLWDPTNELLWVHGDDYLTALKITGTAAAPVITEDLSRRAELPTLGGHDLQAVYGNTDRLWVTTVSGVYQYVKSTKTFLTSYKGSELINKRDVKSIGNLPDGRTVIRTIPNKTFKDYNTNTVDIIHPYGTPSYETRSHMTGAYYKVRVWDPAYELSNEDTTPPTWVDGSVTASDVTHTSLRLNWSGASNDTVAYAVYKDGSFLGAVKDSVYNVKGLIPGTAYNFKIEAADSAGNWSKDGPSSTLSTLSVSVNQQFAYSDSGWGTGINPSADGLWKYEWFSEETNMFSDMRWVSVANPYFEAPYNKASASDTQYYCRIRFSGMNMHPGVLAHSVKTFLCPESGIVEYNLICKRQAEVTGTSNGNSIQIFLNETKVWPEDKDYAELNNASAVTVNTRISVTKGDKIRFMVGSLGNINADGVDIPLQYVKYLSGGRLTPEKEQYVIACVGDSVTEGYTLTGGVKSNFSYPSQLYNALNKSASRSLYTVYNFGKTGKTALKTTVDPYIGTAEYTASLQSNPDIVIIGLGANDSKVVNWNAAAYKEDYKELIRTYQNLPSQPTVYLTYTTYVADPSKTSIQRDVIQNEILKIQREIAAELGIKIIDLNTLTMNNTDKYNDGVHQNDVLAKMMAEYVFNALCSENAVGLEAANATAPVETISGEITLPNWSNGSVTASNVTQTGLTLTWSGASNDTVAYAVYKDGSILGTVTGSVYNVTGLIPGTAYNFKIEAGDAAGNWSKDGPSVSVTTQTTTTVPTEPEVPDTTPPTWVGGSVTPSNVTQTGLTLTWSGASNDTVTYAVYKDGSLIGTITDSVYNVTGLTPGTACGFKIEAGDAAGNWSKDGPNVSVTTQTTTTVPTEPEKPEEGNTTPPSGNGGSVTPPVQEDKTIPKVKIEDGKTIIEIGEVKKSVDNSPTVPKVSVPYKPTAEELDNHEHIVVYYTDKVGNTVVVPSGRYNVDAGEVTFTAANVGEYTIGYVVKSFDDIASVPWAKKEIEVMASKGIILGTSAKTFDPDTEITRADFLMLLVKTLGLTATVDSNFDDVSKMDYYYEALGIAKKLGLSQGRGNNLFDLNAKISRQEMMTLAARAMKMVGKLKASGNSSDLERYGDMGSIDSYAIESIAQLVNEGMIKGDGSMLNPENNTTRAEAAVLMYRIYNKK